jgi:hypothetical protein
VVLVVEQHDGIIGHGSGGYEKKAGQQGEEQHEYHESDGGEHWSGL